MIFFLSLIFSYILTQQFIKWDSPLDKLNYRGIKVRNSGGIIIVLTLLLMSLIQLSLHFDLRVLYYSFGATIMALAGFLDDVFGEGGPKGIKGHLRYLGKFQITTGLIKAVLGVMVALFISRSETKIFIEYLVDVALIAFSINLLNLLDLRPGRACKFFLFMWILTSINAMWLRKFSLFYTFFPVASSTLVFFFYDVAEIVMLGDVGANVLGFCMGLFFVWSLSFKIKLPLTVLIAMTNFAAERYSLSLWIDSVPFFNYLDGIGRKSK